MTRGVRRTVPLFVTCRRPGCERIRQVRTPSEQRTGEYCSRACAARMNQNLRRAGSLGGQWSVETRRRQMLARVDGLTPIGAFRLGYKRGLYSKLRQIRKRAGLLQWRAS